MCKNAYLEINPAFTSFAYKFILSVNWEIVLLCIELLTHLNKMFLSYYFPPVPSSNKKEKKEFFEMENIKPLHLLFLYMNY
jgi:hypothetical protein